MQEAKSGDGRARYLRNNRMIYTKEFFSQEVYERIQQEAFRLWKSEALEPNCNLDGRDRIGGYVVFEPERIQAGSDTLHRLFFHNEGFRQWVSAIVGGHALPADFPMELREYGTGSRGMPCHSDLLMYRNATWDFEFVFTIDNDSECKVSWQDVEGVWQEVVPEGNSLTMVQANAATHCVKCSPRRTGDEHRTMLKWIYAGDLRKSRGFWSYTSNECGGSNPNVKEMMFRRTAEWQREPPSSLEL
jgi:hypothetical protein